MSSASPPVVDQSAQPTMDLEREYLLQNYARYPLVLARGKGCYVYDLEGRRYLDFIAGIGVNALGHAHPRILEGDSRAGRAADPLLPISTTTSTRVRWPSAWRK